MTKSDYINGSQMAYTHILKECLRLLPAGYVPDANWELERNEAILSLHLIFAELGIDTFSDDTHLSDIIGQLMDYVLS